MKLKRTKDGGLPLTTLYVCLVVATVIASATFAYQEWQENVNQTHPQPEEILNEEAEDTPVNQAVDAGYGGTLVPVVAERQPWKTVSNTGVNGTTAYDYCVLTGVVEPTAIQDIRIKDDGSSIRIPAKYCRQLSIVVFQLVELGYISAEDIVIQ